eukprot:COSAG03_NODE_1495_length_3980_cov_32.213862_4_plen_109_part_00
MGEGVRLFFGSRGSAPRTPPSGGPPGALPRAAPAGLSEGSPRAPAAGCQEHGGEGEGTEDACVQILKYPHCNHIILPMSRTYRALPEPPRRRRARARRLGRGSAIVGS